MGFLLKGVTLLEASSATDVASVMSGVADKITAALGSIAPVALGVVGVYLVWKFGVKFFKGLSK